MILWVRTEWPNTALGEDNRLWVLRDGVWLPTTTTCYLSDEVETEIADHRLEISGQAIQHA